MSSEYVSSTTDVIQETHSDETESYLVQRAHIALPSSISSITDFQGGLAKLTFNGDDYREDKDEWLKAVQDLRWLT